MKRNEDFWLNVIAICFIGILSVIFGLLLQCEHRETCYKCEVTTIYNYPSAIIDSTFINCDTDEAGARLIEKVMTYKNMMVDQTCKCELIK